MEVFIIIYEIINEGKINDKADKVKSEISVFFEHMLKWKYKPSYQCSSWTTSIFRSIWKAESIIDGNKNIKIRANKLIHDAYKAGALKASGFCKIDIIKSKDDIENEFKDIDTILNKDITKDWLTKYCRNDSSYKYIIEGYTHDFNKD